MSLRSRLMRREALLLAPAVTAVIPGTASAEHTADNLAAGRARLPGAAQRQKIVEFIQSLG